MAHKAGESIARAAAFIDRNYREKLTVKQMADAAGLSLFYFCRAFRQIKGVTPTHYVRLLRLCCVKRLLRQKETLANAAHECGFSSQSHMTVAFRADTGKTPGQYVRTSRTGSRS